MLESMLKTVVSRPDLHARWLNTFSYLEYVGFRKIVKSQAMEHMDHDTLSHAVEEGRHALWLKKLAMKTGGEAFQHYREETLLCRAAAEDYFQSLDRFCEHEFKKILPESEVTRKTYLCVTWLVEVRALKVYQAYQSVLKSYGLEFPLKALLLEEERHLQAVEEELTRWNPKFSEILDRMKNEEERLYKNYLHALEMELKEEPLVAAL